MKNWSTPKIKTTDQESELIKYEVNGTNNKTRVEPVTFHSTVLAL